MAGGMDLGGSSKGGKKPLDAMINLVPFIDLMAVTIVFLIMTAVWTQLGSMRVSQSGGHGEPTEVPMVQPVTLLITEKQLTPSMGNVPLDPIPLTRDSQGRIDTTTLVVRLRELKAMQPDQAAITLSTEDEVKYDDLVRLLDAVVQYGADPLFPSVTVSPAAVRNP